jgi:transposase
MARSGARWCDLPERFGNYQVVKRRYYDWVRRGDLDKIMTVLVKTADMAWLMIDSTVIRAHQHGANPRKGPKSDIGFGQPRLCDGTLRS